MHLAMQIVQGHQYFTLLYSSPQTRCIEVRFILQASMAPDNALFTTISHSRKVTGWA